MAIKNRGTFAWFIKEIGWSFRPHEPSSLVEKQARRSRKIENKIKNHILCLGVIMV